MRKHTGGIADKLQHVNLSRDVLLGFNLSAYINMPFIERKEEKKKKERINKGDIVKVQITKAYQQSHGVQVFSSCVRPLTCHSPY